MTLATNRWVVTSWAKEGRRPMPAFVAPIEELSTGARVFGATRLLPDDFGKLVPVPSTAPEFFHPGLLVALATGLRPKVNGADMRPDAFEWKTKDATCLRWVLSVPGRWSEGELHYIVWTTVYRDSPIVDFTGIRILENRDTMRSEQGPMHLTWGGSGVVQTPWSLFMTGAPGDTAEWVDGQAQRFFGSIICTAGLKPADYETCYAEMQAPTIYYPDNDFGVLRGSPFLLDEDAGRDLAKLAAHDWRNGFKHPGSQMLSKRPGSTGAQDGFGLVQHTHMRGCAPRRMRRHFYLPGRLLAMQDAARPIHFLPWKGEGVFRPIAPEDDADWVSLSERWHWHRGVSPSTLGRTYASDLDYDKDWWGRDREHHACTWVAEDFGLTGDMATRWQLTAIANHLRANLTLKDGWSTTGRSTGRAQGRMLASAANVIYHAGDRKLGYHMLQWIEKVVMPTRTTLDLTAERVIERTVKDDNRAFNPGTAWIPWEDAILVGGYAVFDAALMQLDRNDALRVLWSEMRSEVMAWVLRIGETVVKYGCVRPNFYAGWTIAKAIRIPDEDGGDWPDLSGDDRWNSLLVLDAKGTEYDLWALPCFSYVVEHTRDSDIAELARRLEDSVTTPEERTENYERYAALKRQREAAEGE